MVTVLLDRRQSEGALGVLDTATLSDHGRGDLVTVKVLPGAMEARIYPTPRGIGGGGLGQTVAEERDYSKSSRSKAVRTIRPFVIEFDLRLAVTTTYAKAVRDPREAGRQRANYRRRLVRAVLQDNPTMEKMPWLYVPEFHASGAIHDHWFLPEVAKPHAVGKWSGGSAHLDELPDVEDQRKFAEYVCEFFDTLTPGVKRYDHARGFKVQEEIYRVGTMEEARMLADDAMTGLPLAWSTGNARYRSESRVYGVSERSGR